MLKLLACVCVEEMLCFKVQYVKGEELLKALRGFGNGFGEGFGKAPRQGGCF